jgi:hypothetical protein
MEPQVKKPATFDTKKGQQAVKVIIRENQKWLKEMASR